MNHFKLHYTAASSQGSRKSNQDNLCVSDHIPFIDPDAFFSAAGTLDTQSLRIFCVCDGIGGERMGDVTALMTLEAVSQAAGADETADKPLTEVVLEAAEAAQQSVTTFLSGIGIMGGCTLTMLAVRENSYALLNIGDSPAFLLRKEDEALIELSSRHNLFWHKRRAGMEPGPADASYLLSYIGKQNIPAQALAYITEGTLSPGDCILLCSDGITNAMDDNSLRAAMADGTDAARLAEQAAAVPHSDNSTVICLTVCEE